MPYGGGPLIATEQPLAEIAGEPTTFVMTDEPDGRLPGLWAGYALEHDGAGGVTWSAEPAPSTYFRVVGGLGMFQYTRAPSLPPPVTPFAERGFAATPASVIEGRNARASVIARQPLLMLDKDADEFVWEVGLAMRLDPSRPRFVGARMRARWAAGVWVTPLILEILAANDGEIAVASSFVPPATPDLLNVWRNQPQTELEVTLRGTELVANIDGIIEAVAQVPDDNYDAEVALLLKVYNRTGPSIIPVQSLVATQFQSLRDPTRRGPPPQIPGALHLEAPTEDDTFGLPMRGLLDAKLVKQLRGRQFQFTQDTEVEVQHQKFFFKEGEVVRIRERLGSQEFVPVTRDLHYQRTRND